MKGARPGCLFAKNGKCFDVAVDHGLFNEPSFTGGIFEVGFTDSLLQKWTAFCDEVVHGREGMRQLFYCATPEETALNDKVFTDALAANPEHADLAVEAKL